MTSKEIFEKILKRKKYVMKSDTARNYAYLGYLKASLKYDFTKKGFYAAMQMERLDGTIEEDRLQQYEHMVKHFDKQLLTQLKDRDYTVVKNSMENKNKEDDFSKRIEKVESTGYLRNRFYFELITNIDEKLHIESIEKIEIEFNNEIAKYRRDFEIKRKGQYYRENSHHGRSHSGRGHHRRGGGRGGGRSVGRSGGRGGGRGGGRSGGRGGRRNGMKRFLKD